MQANSYTHMNPTHYPTGTTTMALATSQSSFAKDTAPKHIKGPALPLTAGGHKPPLRPPCPPEADPRVDSLLDMLTYKRPAGSKAEAKFIKRFLLPLGFKRDNGGNYHKRIGTAPVLWSCHTDTVHRQGGRQVVALSAEGWITAPYSDCLGADDAAGIWLMCEMIKAGVEGLYVFHAEEEYGGIGSSWLARNHPTYLAEFKWAIAFDRMGCNSVITHQFGDRCCSEEFAEAMCKALGGDGWKPDSGGTFTDTANYTDDIGECTNISVGYYDQHTSRERLFLPFLVCLLDTLLGLDLLALPCVRKPGEKGSRLYGDFGGSSTSMGSALRAWYEEEGDAVPFKRSSRRASYDTLLEAVQNYPDATASILEHLGITAEDILEAANGGDFPHPKSY